MSSEHRNAAWMIPHFKQPAAVVPGSSMPPVQLSNAHLNALAAFLLKLNPQNEGALMGSPDFAVKGALVYHINNCGICHMVNGVGTKLGPPLNGVSTRRDKAWLTQHFVDPQKMSPGSVMPAYTFSQPDMEAITAYLLALPKA